LLRCGARFLRDFDRGRAFVGFEFFQTDIGVVNLLAAA
jgi:hypothetical protein